MRTILTIAGSDCSGGSGIQADLKTFAAHNLYGMSVIISVVAENTCGVLDIQDMEPSIIIQQMKAVFEDIPPDAIKIGMLSDKPRMEAVINGLSYYDRPNPIVIDPVMSAKDGHCLMKEDSLRYFQKKIIPLASLLTPNIPEAEILTGCSISSFEDRQDAAKRIYDMGCRNVLIKGGHATGDAVDLLYDGTDFYSYRSPRINTKNTHGTGCSYSSAIASNLALGHTMPESIELAKQYLTTIILHSLNLGKGHGPLNHLYHLFESHK